MSEFLLPYKNLVLSPDEPIFPSIALYIIMTAETQADIQTIKTQSGQTLEGKDSYLYSLLCDNTLTYSEPL
jgi:hypothetical protein